MALQPLSNWTLPDDARQLLDRLIRLPTHNVSPDRQESIDRLRRKLGFMKQYIHGADVDHIFELEAEGVPYMIVQKGKAVEGAFKMLVPCHVDTFLTTEWQSMSQLQGDEKGNLFGHGVYDMQASVLNSLRLINRKIPDNLCLYFAFTGDEELRSHSAQHLVSSWPPFQDVDLVLSSEIGPLEVPEGDDRMRIILGRKGMFKSKATITLGRKGGHGAKSDTPSASVEGQDLQNALCPSRRFPPNKELQGIAPELRSHPAMGQETIFVADEKAESQGLTRPQKWERNFKMLLVPPTTLEEALRRQVTAAENLGKISEWAQRQISCIIERSPSGTSYPPFFIDAKHPYVSLLGQTIATVSGEHPVLTVGDSNADENLYAAKGKIVLSVPHKGGGAHSPREWISGPDIQRNFSFMRTLTKNQIDALIRAKKSLKK